jgi:hypothetical protein
MFAGTRAYCVHELISVSVVPLRDLFSDSFHFRLPYFQRAYAWQTGEIGRLLSDIADAMRTSQRGYFLGKLVVAKKKGQPETALVDGHQRVMSLTLLFAVLRDIESDPKIQDLLNSLIRGTQVRLSPQEAVAPTCERYVQAPGATTLDPESDLEAMSETERNIIENRNYLRTELTSTLFPPDQRRALVAFLAERCCVIVSSVEEDEEAWSFLRTEEETRVDFSKSDRAKFSLLSIIPAEDRRECQFIWEACEAKLGATDMHAMLGHLRTLKRRRTSGKPIEIDLAESYQFNVPGAGLAFFKNQLRPAAERMSALRRPAAIVGMAEKGVAELAERLKWIDAQLWVPAALLWLDRGRGSAETLLFFKRLERLVWLMKIAGFDPTKQSARILNLLGEIDRIGAVEQMRALDVTHELREKAIANLRSPSFDAKHYSGRVLRRISIALGQDPGPVDPQAVTIEHVLPRGYAQRSGWRSAFPTAQSVKLYSHRLGNLTFLSPTENQRADTLDWNAKRPILAGSPFLLSRRLATATDWTPAHILARTEELIGILLKDWDVAF